MSASLVKIQGFVAVVEARQFRKAAETMGLSPAALSAQIRDLERDLGVTLLSRTTRSVRLTAEGERFLYHARRILDELDSAIAGIRDQVDLRSGRLIIAATPSVATNILPRAVLSFKESYPSVRVRVIEDQASVVEHCIETGQADFGIGPLSHRTDLAFSPIFYDRFVGVVPLQHELAKRKRVTLKQLLKYPLLTTTLQSSIRNTLQSIADKRGIELHTEHSLMQQHTVVAMVAVGLGVALLPLLTLASIDRSQVVLLEVDNPEIRREIGILQRKGGSASAAVRAFLPHVRAL